MERPLRGTYAAMRWVKELVRAVDGIQREHAWLALPVAVAKKYTDNRAGNLAALITYYAFLAIFPLLLVLVTVLNILLRSNSGLRHRLLNSALAHYPLIGPELQTNIEPLKQTGVALVVGLLGMLIGAGGVARAMQNALNSAWEIPMVRRPKFPWSWLRSLALLVVIGVGLIITSTLSGLAGGAGNVLTTVGSAVLVLAISLALNVGMFWLGFRLATTREIGWWQLFPGALISAVGWQIMQAGGSYFVTHQLARSSNLYGTFAIVLGAIGWLYVEALLTVCAVETNVVLARHLWPRSLLPPRTDPDMRAFKMYAEVENRGEIPLLITRLASSSAELASVAWRRPQA
jgi:YihY family inner membrane protein